MSDLGPAKPAGVALELDAAYPMANGVEWSVRVRDCLPFSAASTIATRSVSADVAGGSEVVTRSPPSAKRGRHYLGEACPDGGSRQEALRTGKETVSALMGNRGAWALAVCLVATGCVASGPARRPGVRVFRQTGSELIHDSGLRAPARSLQDREETPRQAVAGKSASAAHEPPPPFRYDSYCDRHGHFTYDGAAQALVLQPEHLRQVYLDAAQGQPRAKELVRELEEVFRQFGEAGADATTRPACLPLPELTPACMPNWQFLHEFLGSAPEADRLREVAARAYEARARQRGAQNAIIVAALQLLWAGQIADLALNRVSPVVIESAARTGRARNNLQPDPRAQGPHSTFKLDPAGRVSGHAEWVPNPKNPSGFDQVKRVDTQYGNPHTHHNTATGQEIPTPHVHDKSAPGGVRSARPDELPE